MRLEFNFVIVDDDWGHSRNKRRVDKLLGHLNNKILSKGFKPNGKVYKSLKDFYDAVGNLDVNRFDLYLSDNNLGSDEGHQNDGIQLYLELYEKFPCDFLLYTGAPREKIIDDLTNYLKNNDSHIFSRFSFVSRTTDPNDKWEDRACDLIDIIISKREEMNTLRGIYAQETSRLHKYISNKLSYEGQFKTVIKKLDSQKNQYGLSDEHIGSLHHIRRVRNGILHNDEELCLESAENFTYYLVYFDDDANTQPQKIYLGDFNKFRTDLRDICDLIKQKLN